MKTIREIRLGNARSLAPDGPARFADKLNMMRQQASAIIGSNAHKAIGDKLARRIEAAFEKPEGWLDRDHGHEVGAAAPPPPGGYVDVAPLGEPSNGDLMLRALLKRDRLPTDADPGSWRLTTCKTDSMFDTVPEGFILYVQVGAKVGHGVYLLLIQGHEELRRVVPLTEGKVQLIAENQAVPPVIAPAESIDWIGRVRYVQPPPTLVA